MAQVVESVDVEVPVRTASNQWAQFEEVRQHGDEHLAWRNEVHQDPDS